MRVLPLLVSPSLPAAAAVAKDLRPLLAATLPLLNPSMAVVGPGVQLSALSVVHAIAVLAWPRVHAHVGRLLCTLVGVAVFADQMRSAASGGGIDFDCASSDASVVFKEWAAVHTAALRTGALVIAIGGASAKVVVTEITAAMKAARSTCEAMTGMAAAALAPASST